MQFFTELIEISQKELITVEELKRNTTRPKRAMDGQNSRRLTWIAFG